MVARPSGDRGESEPVVGCPRPPPALRSRCGGGPPISDWEPDATPPAATSRRANVTPESGHRRATLKDVARLADVSRSTASRVLNGHPSVRRDVRRRVTWAMDELGYVPDEVARSLRTGSTMFVLAIPRPPQTVFADAYFAALVAGVVEAGTAHGRTVAVVLVDVDRTTVVAGRSRDGGTPDGATDRATRALAFDQLAERLTAGGQFGGAILTASVGLGGLPAQLDAAGLPVVVIGDPGDDGVCSVDVDNEAGGAMAARHLLAVGCSRIALLGGPASNASARSRQQGARGVVEAGIAGSDATVVWAAHASEFEVAAGHDLMRTCLADLTVAPDGVVAGSDAIAAGIVEAVDAAGLRVPEDVAVVGFDDLSPARTTRPPLTTVAQPITEVAAHAVARLVKLMAGDAEPGVRLVSKVGLVVRASTP